MSPEAENSEVFKYTIDHCLYFAYPGKESGILFLSGWCFDDHSTDSITIDVLAGASRIGSFTPELDRHDVCERNANAPLQCGFHVYLQMDGNPDDGAQVDIEFKNGKEESLNVRHEVTDIHRYINGHIDDLDISEVKKAKLANLLLNETERIHHVKGIKSSPLYLLINPSWSCNLECAYCHADIKRKHGYSLDMMEESTFQKIMERFGEKLISAYLTNRGEPFLNKKTTEYIRTLKGHEIYVTSSSNFNIPYSDEDIDDIVSSGLDRITATLDGATQETYARFRRGGSLSLALDNIRKIIEKRQAYDRKKPRIHWRFMVFEWNEEEVEAARKLSIEIGCDEFEVIRGSVFKSYKPSLEIRDYSFMDSMKPGIRDLMAKYREERTGNKLYYGCDHLYHQITINADGSVQPCNHVHEIRHLFGSIHSKKDIFNSALYTNARGLFARTPAREWQGYDPCLNCWIVTDEKYRGYVPSEYDFVRAYEYLTGEPLTV